MLMRSPQIKVIGFAIHLAKCERTKGKKICSRDNDQVVKVAWFCCVSACKWPTDHFTATTSEKENSTRRKLHHVDYTMYNVHGIRTWMKSNSYRKMNQSYRSSFWEMKFSKEWKMWRMLFHMYIFPHTLLTKVKHVNVSNRFHWYFSLFSNELNRHERRSESTNHNANTIVRQRNTEQ